MALFLYRGRLEISLPLSSRSSTPGVSLLLFVPSVRGSRTEGHPHVSVTVCSSKVVHTIHFFYETLKPNSPVPSEGLFQCDPDLGRVGVHLDPLHIRSHWFLNHGSRTRLPSSYTNSLSPSSRTDPFHVPPLPRVTRPLRPCSSRPQYHSEHRPKFTFSLL